MATKKKANKTTPVESTKHKDKRTNIPTEELRDFVREDETHPKTMLCPRDPSLDPQLVWKGKDEQDQQDLAVPALPVYIQEKIHPRAIIEDIRRMKAKEEPVQQNLFSDFNGLDFEQMIDFYNHGTNWSNRMILGDSLYVMTSLAEKENLKGKIQMIYMDPPYGIKFGSNWQVSTKKRDVKDGKVEDVTRQPEQIRAFRDTWKLGIHSYLSYLRDRLVVARELLTETGSVFVQIGDENVHLVRCLMDEVFGSENFINIIIVVKRSPQPDDFLSSVTDYLLWYCKKRESAKFRNIYKEKDQIDDLEFTTSDLTSSHFYESPSFKFKGEEYTPGQRYWSTSIQGLTRLSYASRIVKSGKSIRYKRFNDDFPAMLIGNNWPDVALSSFGDKKIFVVQTAAKVIERCLQISTDPGDLVLDPTCGSGTTAYVAEQWGRRWITIDTSRVSLALARTRLMSARYPYYLLADSSEGIKKESEITGKLPPEYKTENDIKKGFVYKSVPHITLKSIANNPEIDTIHAKWQEKMETARAKINKLLKQSWEEWEIPRESGEKWSQEGKRLHKEWWDFRKKRQEEIDRSISRNSDREILYDQPYEDRKRVRVSGPFTFESLSPHRILAADEELPMTEREGKKSTGTVQFETMILENLKKAGVQNTIKNERLYFERLEPFAGTWLQAEGEYKENGKDRRVAVAIGPEHGTVGPELVKEAAKEAVKGVGFDLLLVCGFAFDPHVSEEARRYGELTVLPTRMNADLSMGDELLKKTGAGNLFMVFGEPDLEINKTKDAKITVEIKGLDIYDPTTGDIRSHSTDDIACWFIDTDYNEESFFVRQAYFTGANQPYDKLKRALRAEIDEEIWSSLYSTRSRPFNPPTTGKIAIKVINHYGDEVLEVYHL